MPEFIDRTIRGLDKALYKQARQAALGAGVTIGQWINQAIREKLGLKPKK